MKKFHTVFYLLVFALLSTLNARTIYVDGKNGNDGNSGLTPDKSFKTINRAAKIVKPGDTVLVAEGIYYEHVSVERAGKADLPITFKGVGKVIITAADKNLREKKSVWKIEDEKSDIYSTPFDHEPIRLLANGYEMFLYTSFSALKNGSFDDGYPATLHGYFFDGKAKRLYVRFRKGQTPENTVICASPAAPSGSNAHHVWKVEHGNFHVGKKAAPGFIHIDNFTFETPAGSGVITLTHNIVVRNCTFHGCRFGVSGPKCDNVFVENCTYTQKGIYNDVVDIIKRAKKEKLNEKFKFYFWAHKTLRNSKKQMVNFETGILGAAGRGWHLRNSLVEDSFEGFSCWGPQQAKDLQVYGNTFRKIVDNAIETENSIENIRIYNNYFEDVFEPISWQPLAGPPWPGPVFVYRNIVQTTENFKVFADSLDNFMPGVFKLGVAGRNWQYPKHGNVPVSVLAARTSKRFVGAPDPGFLVFNNTMIHPDGGLMTTPNPLDKRALRELVNFRFFNNIIAVKKMHISQSWKAPLVEFYSNLEVDTKHNAFHRGIMSAENGKLIKNTAELKLNKNYELQKNSPAINSGILHFEEPDASTDCGAVPRNTAFDICCGAGSAADTAELSEFRKKVNYHPQLLRSLGFVKGTWAVYSFDKKYDIPIVIPSNAKKLTVIFRPTDCTLPHDDITRKWEIFSAKNYTLSLETDKKGTTLICKNSDSRKSVSLGKLNRDTYSTLEINFNSNIIINGKPAAIKIPKPQSKSGKTVIHRNILYDIYFSCK